MTNKKQRPELETPKGPRFIDCIMAFRENPEKPGQTMIAYYKDRSAEEISYKLPASELHALLREREGTVRFIPVTESQTGETCYIQIDNIDGYERHGEITAIYYDIHESNSCIRPCREDITPIHILETPEQIEDLIDEAVAYRPASHFVEAKPTSGSFNRNSQGIAEKSAEAPQKAQPQIVKENLDI